MRPTPDTSMAGRACLVTGANSGIGRATAMGLARMGATVLMVSRDQGRGEAARADIVRATGNGGVRLLLADLASQQDVRRLATEVQEQYPALHVLINNAGVHLGHRSMTVDGIETTFAVNHLAPFLLTNLLLDLLKKSAPARIVNVSSDAHRGATMNFGSLRAPRRYWGYGVYGRSKLANLLFTYELARRLAGGLPGGLQETGVTANALHPGTVATGMFTSGSPLLKPALGVIRRFLLSAEQGADTVIYLASSPAIAGVSGAYFVRRRAVRSSPASYDEVAQRRLWELSQELTVLRG